MSYEVRLSQGEKPIETITQDLAGKGFLFWRKFTVTLTDKRLHAYQKLMISHGQKTFDLRDIDSVYQEKSFNGIYSFFLGIIAFMLTMFLGLIFRATDIFILPAFIVFMVVFVLYFFKRLLVVRSRNDQMSIDVIRMAEGLLGEFVQAVLKQKETVLGSVSSQHISVSSTNTADKLKQLSELRSQGIITDSEFEAKKKELLKNL